MREERDSGTGNAPNNAAKGVLPRQFSCAQNDARSVESEFEGLSLRGRYSVMLSYRMISQVPERKGSTFDVGGEECGGMIRICELLREKLRYK